MPAGPRHVLLPGSFNKQLGGGGTGGCIQKGSPVCLLGIVPSLWKERPGPIRQLLLNLLSSFSREEFEGATTSAKKDPGWAGANETFILFQSFQLP